MKHVLIIGAGIVGLSSARAALAAGHRVTVLEQGPLPNPQGASYDDHRLIRYQYGTAAGYTRMVTQAFAAWERVWTDLGERHFEPTGALGISMADDDYVAETQRTFETLGISYNRLPSADVERLSPQLTLPEHAWGLLTPDGGVLFASRIVEALLAWNAGQGAELRSGVRVVRVDVEAAEVELEDGELVSGDALIVAAGAWLPELLPAYAAIPTYRQAVCYVDAPEEDMRHWRSGPCLTDLGAGDNYALMPVRGTGLKFGSGAHRRSGKPADGFAYRLDEGYEVIAHFAPYLRNAAAYKPLRMTVGYYVKDGSEQFRVQRSGKSFVVTNCDGQMFKFGPLIGERVLACVDGDIAAPDLTRWAAGLAA